MNKGIITLACAALLLSSCASEFNSVYKFGDSDYKYEFAKEAFAFGLSPILILNTNIGSKAINQTFSMPTIAANLLTKAFAMV